MSPCFIEVALETRNTEASRKRQHVRFAFTGKAQLVLKGDGTTLQGTMLNLSKRGCLLTLTDAREIAGGTSVNVQFHLNRQAFCVSGTVAARRSDHRIGIQFDHLDAGVGRQLGTLSSAGSLGKDNRSEEPLASPEDPVPEAGPAKAL